MALQDDINKVLKNLHKSSGVDKGDPGEYAVLKICEEFYQSYGGILVWSYEYKTDKNEPGNIKMDRNNGNKLYVENLGSTTEIDVLYVSPYKIFPIEVKAYKSKKMELYDDRIDGVFVDSKSPVHQNEMHCRHLYSTLFRALPEGDTTYIVPIVVFVDEASITDNRSDWQKSYILVRTLDTLRETIDTYNEPSDYRLNLSLVDKLLKDIMSSNRCYLPARY